MDNFFETYLEWIIEKYNDGDNINDILTSGYTANTGTYYCPNNNCSLYVLASIETYLAYAEGAAGINLNSCCLNINANVGTYLNFAAAVNGFNVGYCCLTNNFCLESNVSQQNIAILLDKGIIEQGSSSEINNTNLCYLFDRLNQEEYSELQVLEISSSILDKGIVIWCCNGIISAISADEYIRLSENCETCFFRWFSSVGQSQFDACNTTSVFWPELVTESSDLQIGDLVYDRFGNPFDGNNNWFRLELNCVNSLELVFVVQINNNGEIIDIGCPTI